MKRQEPNNLNRDAVLALMHLRAIEKESACPQLAKMINQIQKDLMKLSNLALSNTQMEILEESVNQMKLASQEYDKNNKDKAYKIYDQSYDLLERCMA